MSEAAASNVPGPPDTVPGDRTALPDEEALAGADGSGKVRALVADELGEQAAHVFAQAWQARDLRDAKRLPDEGLRERKKRETGQRISDVATALFVSRGFDSVRVAEIADKVGVSEKTIYNYFPTKETLVFDQTEEQMATLAATLRDRAPGVSPTLAIVTELKRESARFTESLGDNRLDFLPAFGRMVRETPSLRAHWAEHRNQLVDAVTTLLAAEAGIDPREPEPIVAASALVSLVELLYDSMLRHIEAGLGAAEIRAAIDDDLDRAGRLLDTGLWSLHLIVEGRRTKQQLLDAANAAEHARKQVVGALREARLTWRRLREEQRERARVERDRARR
jgi:AcrR family transcriptional regulator